MKFKLQKICKHKKKQIGYSACDKILECKCGKWMKYCNSERLSKL